ncbi:MAG: hypothetical protein AAF512_17200 [Pseudomonadota bacterium]
MAKKLPENFDWKAITPDDSPMTPPEIMADERHKRLSAANIQAGDMAYNFTSPIYDFSDGVETPTGKHFDLLEISKEKPVALIFGSYT